MIEVQEFTVYIINNNNYYYHIYICLYIYIEIDMSYNKIVGEYVNENSCIIWCKFVEDDYKILSVSSDGNLYIFESSSSDCLYRIKCHKNNILDCDLNNKENQLISCGLDNEIKLIDLERKEIIRSYEGNNNNKNGYIKCVKYLKDNERFVSGESNGKIIMWSINDNINRLGVIDVNENVIIMSLCIINEEMMLCSSNDGYLKLYNLKNEKLISPLSYSLNSIHSFISKIIINEKQENIICVSFDNHILVYSLNDYSLLKVKSYHGSSILSICLSVDGLYLYIGSSMGIMSIIEI